LHSNIIY
jgi:hypothetical protein